MDRPSKLETGQGPRNRTATGSRHPQARENRLMCHDGLFVIMNVKFHEFRVFHWLMKHIW